MTVKRQGQRDNSIATCATRCGASKCCRAVRLDGTTTRRMPTAFMSVQASTLPSTSSTSSTSASATSTTWGRQPRPGMMQAASWGSSGTGAFLSVPTCRRRTASPYTRLRELKVADRARSSLQEGLCRRARLSSASSTRTSTPSSATFSTISSKASLSSGAPSTRRLATRTVAARPGSGGATTAPRHSSSSTSMRSDT